MNTNSSTCCSWSWQEAFTSVCDPYVDVMSRRCYTLTYWSWSIAHVSLLFISYRLPSYCVLMTVKPSSNGVFRTSGMERSDGLNSLVIAESWHNEQWIESHFCLFLLCIRSLPLITLHLRHHNTCVWILHVQIVVFVIIAIESVEIK